MASPPKSGGLFIFTQMDIKGLYNIFLSSPGIATDTRKIRAGNIFFALQGEKFNANHFVEEAFNKGARYVIADQLINFGWKKQFGENLIIVQDALSMLQQLSGYHRKQLKGSVLAITGSNGKTTTKELIAAVLSKKYKTYSTKGNLNNHIGIPLTLLSVQLDAEFIIVEMGANHQGEIASYCEYVQPDFGLITNVGVAHTEGFGGFEGVVKGKTELYRYIIEHNGRIFINGDNEILVNTWSKLLEAKDSQANAIAYGQSPSAFCKGKLDSDKEFISVVAEGYKIQTHLIGGYNFENLMSAICIGKYFGVEKGKIGEAIENYIPTNNRSQKLSFLSNTIILDAYNANPSSMCVALENFEKIEVENKVIILGEMMELGDYSIEEHDKIISMVTDNNWNKVKKVFVGKGFELVRQRSNRDMLWFEKTDEVKSWFKAQQFENCYILIKGSRKNELEKILEN
jgi:UDP-N-acetylmuramoyl-tripeptide--D-alanyl-D-alanine ligase